MLSFGDGLLIVLGALATLLALRELRATRASQDVSALFDYIGRSYLDHEFSVDTPPTDSAGTPITGGRLLKTHARNMDKAAWSAAVWPEAAPRRWENQLAYQLSIVLERLGIAAFSGAVPLRLLLPLAADQILEDWTLCKPWVDGYRAIPAHAGISPPFHRRYAEWLACVAALWMARHHPTYGPLRDVQGLYAPNQIRQTVLLQLSREAHLLGPLVQSELGQLAGVHSWRALLRTATRVT